MVNKFLLCKIENKIINLEAITQITRFEDGNLNIQFSDQSTITVAGYDAKAIWIYLSTCVVNYQPDEQA